MAGASGELRAKLGLLHPGANYPSPTRWLHRLWHAMVLAEHPGARIPLVDLHCRPGLHPTPTPRHWRNALAAAPGRFPDSLAQRPGPGPYHPLPGGIARRQSSHRGSGRTNAGPSGGGIRGDRSVHACPLNILLWRIVVVDGESYQEGYSSLLDPPGALRFRRYGSAAPPLWLAAHPDFQRLSWFTHGFYRLRALADGAFEVADLRMGSEPRSSLPLSLRPARGARASKRQGQARFPVTPLAATP